MQTLASPPSSAVTTRKLTSIGHELELDENSFGWLEDSSSIRGDAAALQQRMDENGYLYIKGFFNRDIILEARQVLLETLEKDDIFEPGKPLGDGILKQGVHPHNSATAWRDQPSLNRVVFGPEVHDFYSRFLGGTIRHFDYIWLRTMGCGHGTPPTATSFTWAAARIASIPRGSLTAKYRSKSAVS